MSRARELLLWVAAMGGQQMVKMERKVWSWYRWTQVTLSNFSTLLHLVFLTLYEEFTDISKSHLSLPLHGIVSENDAYCCVYFHFQWQVTWGQDSFLGAETCFREQFQKGQTGNPKPEVIKGDPWGTAVIKSWMKQEILISIHDFFPSINVPWFLKK